MRAFGRVRFLSVFGALVVGGCLHTADEAASDLERTWLEATVVLPSINGREPEFTKIRRRPGRRLALEGLARPLPTVVYMHGCTGIGNRTFLKRLALAGFAVIAPDSLARNYRPLQCDPRNKTGGYNLFVYEFRLAEIAYALDRVGELSWVDRSNLFLLGSSEGGVAAALYRGDEFRARVIAQWTCNGAPIVRGIGAPAGEPVLAIVAAKDPWYDPARTRAQNGHCGEFMAGRSNSQSVVLQDSASHDVFRDPRSADLIVSFLARSRRN